MKEVKVFNPLPGEWLCFARDSEILELGETIRIVEPDTESNGVILAAMRMPFSSFLVKTRMEPRIERHYWREKLDNGKRRFSYKDCSGRLVDPHTPVHVYSYLELSPTSLDRKPLDAFKEEEERYAIYGQRKTGYSR